MHTDCQVLRQSRSATVCEVRNFLLRPSSKHHSHWSQSSQTKFNMIAYNIRATLLHFCSFYDARGQISRDGGESIPYTVPEKRVWEKEKNLRLLWKRSPLIRDIFFSTWECLFSISFSVCYIWTWEDRAQICIYRIDRCRPHLSRLLRFPWLGLLHSCEACETKISRLINLTFDFILIQ